MRDYAVGAELSTSIIRNNLGFFGNSLNVFLCIKTNLMNDLEFDECECLSVFDESSIVEENLRIRNEIGVD